MQPLVLGVSGGADSLALMLACETIRQGPMTVVHVHHHLRLEAESDAQHVQTVCESLAIPFRLEHVHPAGKAGNLAAHARRLRYEALLHVAQDTNSMFVAVAHHAEDQLETMLMALCRGAGIDGFSAMAWKRRLDEDITLIRPLLTSRKSECESLCLAAGIKWIDDASNLDRSKSRVRLRVDVLPVLEDLWPGASERAAATAEILHAASALVEERLQAVFGDEQQHCWDRKKICELHAPLIAAGLRRAAVAAQGGIDDDMGQRQLMPVAEAILDSERRPRRFKLSRNLSVVVTADEITLQRQSDQT